MIEQPQPKNLELKGVIKDRNLIIFVDFDSTHNCIDIVVSKQLNLFAYATKDFIMMDTNGKKVEEV